MTAETVFLDTSAIYEIADRGGSRHREVADTFARLIAEKRPLAMTDLVLAELHGLTLGRLGPEKALLLVDRLTASARLELVPTGPDVLGAAIDLLRARPGRRISLVDAASFVVMSERAIGTAFALDADFAAEGFTTLP